VLAVLARDGRYLLPPALSRVNLAAYTSAQDVGLRGEQSERRRRWIAVGVRQLPKSCVRAVGALGGAAARGALQYDEKACGGRHGGHVCACKTSLTQHWYTRHSLPQIVSSVFMPPFPKDVEEPGGRPLSLYW
jgi:hypothetical protein